MTPILGVPWHFGSIFTVNALKNHFFWPFFTINTLKIHFWGYFYVKNALSLENASFYVKNAFLPPNCWKSPLLLKKWPPPHFGSKWPKNDPPTPILGGHMTPPGGGVFGGQKWVKNDHFWVIFHDFFQKKPLDFPITFFSKKNPWISLLLFFKKMAIFGHFWPFCHWETHHFLIFWKKTIEFDNQKWPFFHTPKKVISCTPLNLIIIFGPPLNLIIKFGRPPKRGVHGSFWTHFWGQTQNEWKKPKFESKIDFFHFWLILVLELIFLVKIHFFIKKTHFCVKKTIFFRFLHKSWHFCVKKTIFLVFLHKVDIFRTFMCQKLFFFDFFSIKKFFRDKKWIFIRRIDSYITF